MKNRRIESLKLNTLLVDFDPENGGYQRKLNKSDVSRGVKSFNIALVDTPLIAKRPNGDLFIVDGQHTRAILIGVGIDTFQCNVMDSTGRTEEAPVFIACNEPKTGGVNVKPYDRYIAGISCQHPTYLKIRDLMNSVDVAISNNRNPSYQHTNAIGTIQDLINLSSLPIALKFIKETWPIDNYSWSADMIKGCTVFISKLSNTQIDTASKKLKKKTCAEIISKSESIARALDKHKRNCVPDVLRSLSGCVL